MRGIWRHLFLQGIPKKSRSSASGNKCMHFPTKICSYEMKCPIWPPFSFHRLNLLSVKSWSRKAACVRRILCIMHVESICFASSGCIFGMGLRGLYIQVQHMGIDEAAKKWDLFCIFHTSRTPPPMFSYFIYGWISDGFIHPPDDVPNPTTSSNLKLTECKSAAFVFRFSWLD